MEIGGRADIGALLHEHKMSLKQLSDRFGIPYRTVQHWVGGERRPPDYVVRLIAAALEAEQK